jgi:hypothetical protein
MRNEVIVSMLIVAILAGAGVGFLVGTANEHTTTSTTTATSVSTTTATSFITKTSLATQSNTYLTSCIITGVGGFEFRVISDPTGAPISGETIEAVDRLGCNGQNQVVYLDNFSESQGGQGWLVPDFPSQATPAGGLSFTIMYQGGTYTFSASVAPVGTNCVTLHVPSGNVTVTFVANGSGSYCS